MTTKTILQRLQNVHPVGGGWIARCPAPDDRDPSPTVIWRVRAARYSIGLISIGSCRGGATDASSLGPA